ncbi:peptidoglycan-binding protein [Desulfosarcina sp.]|nr:peptidoglycan-binding protein [Desulfosarcina sp.]
MSINQSIYISGSVGMFGINKQPDVKTVQRRLNELMSPSRRKLVVDGVFGFKTGLAITQFQRYACGFKWPDGLIETDKSTIRLLNDPKSAAKWAIACPISDEQIDRFISWWNSTTAGARTGPTPTSAKNKQILDRLRRELLVLDRTVKSKYPKGRPDGLGVLAFYTHGKGMKQNLTWLVNKINGVNEKYGAGWGCVTALVSTVAVPYLVVYGSAEDAVRSIYELTFEPEVHGKPAKYDILIGKVRALKLEIDKLD